MQDIHIKASELKALLEDENTPPEVLDKYFETVFDEAFAGRLVLRPHVYVEPDDDDVEEFSAAGIILNLANLWSRNNRLKKYQRRLKTNPHAVRLMAEGDSWFQHPHPKVLDIIDQLFNHYAIYCIGAAGDTVRNMFQGAEFLDIIHREKPRVLLLSGGGNDILGSQFRHFLADEITPGTPGEHPERFLKDTFLRELESIGGIYDAIFRRLRHEDIDIVVHGYDYVIPLSATDKGWLGRYMIEKGIAEPTDREAIVRWMIDRFNEKISSVAAAYPRVHYLDLRNTVRGDQWYDEIHPTSAGYQDLALRYHRTIEDILAAS